jgi:hypothetical protein
MLSHMISLGTVDSLKIVEDGLGECCLEPDPAGSGLLPNRGAERSGDSQDLHGYFMASLAIT